MNKGPVPFPIGNIFMCILVSFVLMLLQDAKYDLAKRILHFFTVL